MKGRIKLRHLIICGISAICIIISLILFLVCRSQINDLDHQQMARRWSEDGGYSQVSVFYTYNAGFTADRVPELRYNIDKKLTDASLEGSYAERTWLDCYSVSQSLTLTTAGGKTSANTVYGIGGDWFQFHPLRLISGSYFAESDLMHDLIVIDELTAWNLFGSNNCVGMTVEISGLPYIICGVVQADDSEVNALATGKGPVAYMAFDMLAEGTTAHCYEALLPQPIPGFALDTVKNVLGSYDSNALFIENTDRFSIENEYNVLKNMPTRSMQTVPVVYPYWENAARLTESRLAFQYLAILLLMLVPILSAAVWVVLLWKRRKWRFSGIKNKVSDSIYDASCKRASGKTKLFGSKTKGKHEKARKKDEKTHKADKPAADADNASEPGSVQ
ncbi:MAG: ABC transporter permease [Ruminococcaceae bacterium]|nr:ABC transporter permease [Oscillospiraceae bacterium]